MQFQPTINQQAAQSQQPLNIIFCCNDQNFCYPFQWINATEEMRLHKFYDLQFPECVMWIFIWIMWHSICLCLMIIISVLCMPHQFKRKVTNHLLQMYISVYIYLFGTYIIMESWVSEKSVRLITLLSLAYHRH